MRSVRSMKLRERQEPRRSRGHLTSEPVPGGRFFTLATHIEDTKVAAGRKW